MAFIEPMHRNKPNITYLLTYSLSGKTSYHQISRSREIGCYNDRIPLKFDRQLDSGAAELPVKFQSNWKSLNPSLATSRLHEILR